MKPKQLKACRSCRRSKMKCESRDNAKCQRCADLNLECIYETKVFPPTTASGGNCGDQPADAEWRTTVESRLESLGSTINTFGSTLNSILALLQGGGGAGGAGAAGVAGAAGAAAGAAGAAAARADAVAAQVPNHHASQPSQSTLTTQPRPSFDQIDGSLGNLSGLPAASSHAPTGHGHSDDYAATHPDTLLDDLSASEYSSRDMDDFLVDLMSTQGDQRDQWVAPGPSSGPDPGSVSGLDPVHGRDLRTNGTFSYEQAKQLFEFFHERISPYLFGFRIADYTLDTVWTRSPILLAAICTVASLHHPQLHYLFDGLKEQLDGLSQGVLRHHSFSQTETIDTIVALCVAGFWLPDMSMLTAIAIRLARNLSLNMPNATDKDRLRLWYLLYVLDGHQALIYDNAPTVAYHDPAALHSRALLLDRSRDFAQLARSAAESPSLWGDMRLVSQVEFNLAVKSIFEQRGWAILNPKALGIPQKTNIDLDKWMVSWTCHLSPDGAAWPSKSTLIHYNYAKMFINSSAIQAIQNATLRLGDSSIAPSAHLDQDAAVAAPSVETVGDSIAVSAAQNVLRLCTADRDVIGALQYVPIHVHMMLYYAALLLLHSLSPDMSKQSLQSAMTLVRRLKRVLADCANGQHRIIADISQSLAHRMDSKALDIEAKSNTHLVELYEDEAEHQLKIAGWPGSQPNQPARGAG